MKLVHSLSCLSLLVRYVTVFSLHYPTMLIITVAVINK